MEPQISKLTGREFGDNDRKMLARSWEERGCCPVTDSSVIDPVTRQHRVDTVTGLPAQPKWSPVLMPVQSQLVREFLALTAECTRDDYGRPSPRDFDHVMDREGLGPRRQGIMRSLLRARNQEADAISQRRTRLEK